MLVAVPFLVRHPGTTVADAAAMFAIPEAQLRRDLELLMMSGVPPYGPGDLIDVDVDEDDAIWITMADHFSRPLRMTRHEALAVRLRATELMATPGIPEAPDLASAVRKLDATLGEAPIEAGGSPAAPALLDEVRAASEARLRLAVTYVAASTTERTERIVEPEAVFSSLGNWYVAVWDTGADAERLLRIDRIIETSPTGETFEPRGLEGAGRPLYRISDEDVRVRLRLGPAARWVAEYYATTDLEERADGALDATLPARKLGWVVLLLLRLGPDATVLEPAGLADEVRAAAQRTLAAYAD
jgi:proteasome accessory factor C